jgi:transglutaminase-like putative cysteine protease
MTLARWRGHEPRLASMTGRVNIPGAQIQALDSRSGWATLADREGYFILPDVLWYPFATYDLVISADGEKGKIVRVTAPERLPEDGMFDTEAINLEQGAEVDLSALSGVNANTFMAYDAENTQYYKDLFDRLTAGKESDDERIDAANQYVATKLSFEETPWEVGSPRRVLESGSQYCGHLSAALATLLATGEYRTREIDLTDGKSAPYTHVAVEVFYDGGWHLYDPTYGVRFLNNHGKVASYKDVRLDTSIITEDLFVRFPPQKRLELAALLPSVYGSGFHHFYCFKNR